MMITLKVDAVHKYSNFLLLYKLRFEEQLAFKSMKDSAYLQHICRGFNFELGQTGLKI